MAKTPARRAAIVCALAFASGCSDKAEEKGNSARAQVLDPAQEHYGKSYSDWNAEWFKWIYEMPLDDACDMPLDDSTGEHCTMAQPDNMFFLAGNLGISEKVIVRDKCVAPANRPIFFPIMNTVADNGGIPPEQQLPDEQNEASARGVLDEVQPNNLTASVDGNDVPDLASFKTDIVEFSYVVPGEPNFYSCQGAPG